MTAGYFKRGLSRSHASCRYLRFLVVDRLAQWTDPSVEALPLVPAPGIAPTSLDKGIVRTPTGGVGHPRRFKQDTPLP
jgi:hypothetical protein